MVAPISLYHYISKAGRCWYRELVGIGRKTETRALVLIQHRCTACPSRRGRREPSRRSGRSLLRLWCVYIPFYSFSRLPLSYTSLGRTMLTDRLCRAQPMSASTRSSTRRSGSPASRVSHSASGSVSAVSVTTRRARRRSCTVTCRRSMSRARNT